MKTRFHSKPRVCGIALAVALLTTPSVVNADVTLQSDESSPWTQDGSGVWSSPALTKDESSSASFTVTGPCFVKAKYRLVLEGATSSDKYSADFYLGNANANLADGWREISSIIWDEGETDVSVSVYSCSDGTLTAYLKDIVVEPATIGSEVIDGLEWSYAASLSSATVTSVYTEDGGEPEGDVTVPATLGGQPVTEIAGGVLCWCGDLTSLTFPDSVKKIGDRVGGGCEALESVTFGAGFESMAEYAFVRCYALQSFTVSAANQNFSSHDGALYSKDGTKLILCPAGKKSLVTASGTTEIAENACMDSESLVSLVIGGGVATVGDRAFYNCYQLRDLSLPDSLESIGEEAFNETAVTSLTLPSGLKSIGANAFAWCGGLTTLVVPTGIESIGEGAFVECGSLSAVYLPKNLEGVLDVASVFGSSFDSSLITWYETLTYYTVTLDANYAGGTQTQLQVLKFIDELPVPATRTGYAFSGWWSDQTDEDVAEQLVAGAEITGNATYYAHWVTESRFTFGGDVAWFAAESENGAATTIQSGPLGYGQTSTASMSVTGTGRIMVYYANNSYADSLCVYVDGAKLASFGYADGNYGYVDVFTQGAHTITFSYENESGDPESFAQIYEVGWTPQDSYTVTLNANGGTVSPAALTVLGTLPELPMPRKNGGVFAGWYTAAEGGERAVAGDEVTADTTLYARWVDVPFTVGGDKCWMLDADGSYVSESLELGEEIYAEVRFTGPCRVSFDWKADASYWSNNAFEFYVDGVRTNALQATSGGTPYWDTISLDVEGDGEHVFRWLFANDDPWGTSYSNSNRVWFKNVVVGSVSTITFDENYEDGSVFNELCAGKLGTLPVPKRDDYFMFTGWWTQREGGTQVTSETSVTGEATYYAHWAPTPYKFDGEWFEDVDGSWRPMATDTWTSYSATKDVEGPCTVSFKWKAVIFGGYHTVNIYDIVNGGYTTLVNTSASTDGWVEQTLTISDGSVHTIKAEFYSGSYASSSYYIALKDFVVTPLASYTLTFNPNYPGGTNVTRKVIQEDAVVGNPPSVWRSGYAVNGWWTTAEGGERISAATTVSADTTYYAHWVECPFTSESTARPWEMGPDGEWRTARMDTYSSDYGATLTVQGPCVVTFDWRKDVGSTGRYMRLELDGAYNSWCESTEWETKSVTFTEEGEHTIFFDAYVNSASYATTENNCYMVRNIQVVELVPCVVTFSQNYAGAPDATTKNYVAGDFLGKLPAPERSGYDFVGWFTDPTAGTQVTAETVVVANMTVYARWAEIVYCTVTFNENYSGAPDATTLDVRQNAAIGELPSARRSGYALVGWFTAAEGGTQITAETVVSSAMTVYAHWIEATSFDSTGGDANWGVEADGSWKSGTITHSQNTWAEVTVAGPCRVSFKWKTSSESGYDKLHLYVDGSTEDYVSPISGTMSDWAEVSFTLADSGEHTVRWTYSKDGSQSTASDCGWVKDFAVVAVEACTVTFNENYSGAPDATTRNVVTGEALGALPSAARTGYDFVGWFTDPTAGTQVTAETLVVADITVYARWEEIVYCTVTFDLNYSGAPDATTLDVRQNAAIGELPSETRTGYKLVGWFTAASGGTEVTAATVVNANITVYARWEERGPEITYELRDSYGDGWNGAAINVINVATEEVIANLTIPSGGSYVEGSISVSGGMQLRFEWQSGSWDSETSYTILGVNDEEILSGSDAGFSEPVVYVVPGGAAEPPSVTIDDTKMEEPVVNEDGSRTIAAKDGVTLTQSDVESVTIASPSDPTVDITAAYKRELDSANNQIVVTLAAPETTAVDAENKDAEDATGILEDVSKIDDGKIAELPTPDTSDPDPAKHEEVGALPVKMYKGLWYQASWGDDLNNLTPGTKFQADGTKTHIGVIKQKGACGFYKLSVSEK